MECWNVGKLEFPYFILYGQREIKMHPQPPAFIPHPLSRHTRSGRCPRRGGVGWVGEGGDSRGLPGQGGHRADKIETA